MVQFPYRGCVAAGLSSQDAWELYTLRSTLEGLAARLAAEAITLDKRKLLDAALQKLVKAAKRRLAGSYRCRFCIASDNYSIFRTSSLTGTV
ncbi:MAG: FCD domain-containing protein [Chroococcidiopsidaceae cyanobacterium CP_BM_RX_35]|nr:FCD domain-containing protein [Chroococcidiopsidaceae cyanobacterium CP_BM_RX_35]